MVFYVATSQSGWCCQCGEIAKEGDLVWARGKEFICKGCNAKNAAEVGDSVERLLNDVRINQFRAVEDMSDSDFETAIRDRAVKQPGLRLLVDAHPTWLIHELLRQHIGVTTEEYDSGWGGIPVGCDILIPKKTDLDSASVRHFAPRVVDDYDIDKTDNANFDG